MTNTFWEVRTNVELALQRAAFGDYVKRCGYVVQEGPFARMRYLTAVREALLAKLVGCYEAEIHPWIQSAIERKYRTIIDVGSAEGYYSVGMALATPDAKVYSFDIDPGQQQLCRSLAELNEVEHRLAIRGEFTRADFNLAEPGNTLLKMDCEGAEFELLDPVAVPMLRQLDILVEIHVQTDRSPDRLLEPFKSSHTIALVKRQRRHAREWKSVSPLSPLKRYASVLEFRDGLQCWAFLRQKSSPALSE